MQDGLEPVGLKLTETGTFIRSAAKFYVAREVLELGELLLSSPYMGQPVQNGTEAILKARHPKAGETAKGFSPVVVYCVNAPDSEIILIDVIEDAKSLTKWLDDPVNEKLVVRYGRLLVRIIYGALSGDN